MNRNTRAGIAAGTLAGIFITLTAFSQWFIFYYHYRPTESFFIVWLVIPSLFIVVGAGISALFGGVIGHTSIKKPIRSIRKEMLKGAAACLVLLVFTVPFQVLTGRPTIAGIIPVIAGLIWVGVFFPCFDKWTK